MNQNELLDLIARGETEDLLMQKNLTRRLNALVSIGLVDIQEGKILITPKGKQVQQKRKLIHLENLRVEKDLEEFSSSTFKRNSFYVYLSLVVLCTVSVFLFIIIVQEQ